MVSAKVDLTKTDCFGIGARWGTENENGLLASLQKSGEIALLVVCRLIHSQTNSHKEMYN